jgi:fatty acid-binding protein DegV
MSVKIIVDSTADLLPAQKARVQVVPLTVHFGNKEYIDGVNIDHKTFYEMLVESDELPSTSQATPAAFSEAYHRVTQDGDSAVVITLSHKLSGTYQSAMIAAEDYANFIAEQTAHFVEALMKEMECVEPLSFEEMVELYGSYHDEEDRLYTICPECGGHIYLTDWEPECSCCDCGYTENEEDY